MIRKHYTSTFKAQVVRELLKEDKTLAELATEHGIHPTQLIKLQPFLESDVSDWEKVHRDQPLRDAPLLQSRAAGDGGSRVRQGGEHRVGRRPVGSSGEAVYSATKGGIIAFTKTLAREMARHKINVNCVCPGPADTRGTSCIATLLAARMPLSMLCQSAGNGRLSLT